MSQVNITVIRGMYESFSKGDVTSVLGQMHQHIEWREAENFICADRNPYHGPQAVLEGVFMRLASEWGFQGDAGRVAGCRESHCGARYLQRQTQRYR
jgi:hypothetical protein